MKVIAFGSFDPLHPGHIFFLQQARALGDYLVVVVARDEAIQARKARRHFQGEQERLKAVSALSFVDEARLGSQGTDPYMLLSELVFDVLVLGYDQEPSHEIVRAELNARGKESVKIVRLSALRPELHKSTLIRSRH